MATASSSNHPPARSDDPVMLSSLNTITAPQNVEVVDANPSPQGEEQKGRQEAGIRSLSEEVSTSWSAAAGGGGGGGGDDATETIAKGIASVLGPIVRLFETRVDEVLQSQDSLQSSLDRLTRELDKLLEDTPLPLGAQHAAKLSGIRKRVGSLTETLRIIQGRINSMDHMLLKQKSVGSLH